MPSLSSKELSVPGSDASGEQRTYVRIFETVWSDGKARESDIDTTIVAVHGVTLLSSHPDNINAKAMRASHVQSKDNPNFWESTYTFEHTRRDAKDQQTSIAYPPNRPARVSMNWESIRVPCPDDRDGKMIKNSAGQVPDPRVEIDGDTDSYHIEADVGQIPLWVFTYRSRRGCINDAPFDIVFESGQRKRIGTGCGRLRDLKVSTLKLENGYPFYTVSFNILNREPPVPFGGRVLQEGWVFDMVDQGMMEIAAVVPGTGIILELKHILDQNANNVTTPVPLDGTGHPLPAGSATELVVIYFDVFAQKNFTILPGCSFPI